MDARKRVHYRVEVMPDLHRFGFNAAAARAVCQDIAAAIKRHIDNVESVHVASDLVCKDCGGRWTEKSTVYNRGCCDADIDRGDSLAREGEK